MKRFYVELLGFVVEWEPDPDNVYLSSGIDNLALHRSTALTTDRSASATAAGALDHLGLIVANAGRRGSVGGVSREPRRDDRRRSRSTHRDGARSCYFSDPDGNSVQIIHHPPISQKT